MADAEVGVNRRWVAVVVLALTAAGLAIPLVLPGGAGNETLLEQLVGTLGLAAFAAGGALIAWRLPRHPVGWLFSGLALSEALVRVSIGWARYALITRDGDVPGGELAGWVYGWAWALPTFLPVFVAFLFPDGSPPGRIWRAVTRAAAAALLVLVIASSLYPSLFEDQQGWPAGIDNPLGIPGATPVLDVVTALALFLLAIAGALSVISVIVRYRRAGEVQRQQLRLVFGAGALVGVGAVVPTPDVVGVASLAVLAVTATLAILRHRLYGVQVVASRSIVYASLAALTTVIYLVVVATVGAAAETAPQNDLPIAVIATALAATAFQPLRAAIERRARRLVFGPQADPYALMAEFARRLGASVPLDEVAETLARTIATGFAARSVTVTVAGPDGRERSTTVPLEPANKRGEGIVVDEVTVTHHGRVVGRIRVRSTPDRWGPAEATLLRDLAAQASASLANVALTAELRARAEELADSRRRLVTAQDRERRRIERDLHDGAQQFLVGLGAQLGMVRCRVSDRDVVSILDRSTVLVDEAVNALRALARGVYPHVLTDRGVVAALRAHVDNVVLPFSTRIVGPASRWGPEAEAAVYFCCLEAMQNAAKHAAPTTVEITIEDVGDQIRFTVTDDGVGVDIDRAQAGQGIANMVDRMGALGGELTVQPSAGAGTTVSGWVPTGVSPVRRETGARLGPDDARLAHD